MLLGYVFLAILATAAVYGVWYRRISEMEKIHKPKPPLRAGTRRNVQQQYMPPDLDNRWPGYPLRKGDPALDPNYKGAWGQYPTMKYVPLAERSSRALDEEWVPTAIKYPSHPNVGRHIRV